jgi:hypothetical protein
MIYHSPSRTPGRLQALFIQARCIFSTMSAASPLAARRGFGSRIVAAR